MMHGKTIIIVLIALAIGFGSGFTLRPMILPPSQTTLASSPSPAAALPLAASRGTQYFAANLDEARRIVAGCRDGSVRGGECANAEEAITTVEAQERRKRFLGH